MIRINVDEPISPIEQAYYNDKQDIWSFEKWLAQFGVTLYRESNGVELFLVFKDPADETAFRLKYKV